MSNRINNLEDTFPEFTKRDKPMLAEPRLELESSHTKVTEAILQEDGGKLWWVKF